MQNPDTLWPEVKEDPLKLAPLEQWPDQVRLDPGAISVLHLDGNHDEAAVAQDFKQWGSLVVPGGWVIFDDYNWPHGDGPRKVADRAIAEYGDRVSRRFVAGGAMFVNLAP